MRLERESNTKFLTHNQQTQLPQNSNVFNIKGDIIHSTYVRTEYIGVLANFS